MNYIFYKYFLPRYSKVTSDKTVKDYNVLILTNDNYSIEEFYNNQFTTIIVKNPSMKLLLCNIFCFFNLFYFLFFGLIFVKKESYWQNMFKSSHQHKNMSIFFDEVSESYDYTTRTISLWQDQDWKKDLVDFIPKNTNLSIADLACGTGDLCQIILNNNPDHKVIGVDIAPKMLDIAKSRIPNCDFLLQSCEDSFCPNESLDYITASYCYRNVNDLSKALETSYRSIKPGRYLLILDMFKLSNMVYYIII